MVYYILPAREGSKRLPHKNRKLLKYTIDSLPKRIHERVIVTTDDPWIWERVGDYDVKLLKRDKELAQDETSTRAVLRDVAKKFNFDETDDFVLLYLTYPQREFKDIKKALKFYKEQNAKSLLCKQPVKSHPYLCMYEKDDYKGEQIVEHDLYRYQDYPGVFEISHYIAITQVGELNHVNKNLYNEETVFFPIDNVIDVDHEQDLEKYLDQAEEL